jgi:hypothetical protein
MASKTKQTKKPSNDPIADLFGAWRLWLLGVLLGAVVAAGLYLAAPPGFRARATVVVDNNLEEAWTYFPDRQLFQFLARETERLVELVWADSTLRAVEAQTGVQLADLRDGRLQLSQPSDGGWHFYARDAEAPKALLLAAAWAQAFVDEARAAVSASPELQMARAELDAALFSDPPPSEEHINQLLENIARLAERTKGVSPYAELYVSQSTELPAERTASLGTYLLIGSLIGAFAAPLWVVLRKPTLAKTQ